MKGEEEGEESGLGKTFGEWFFVGFARVTGTIISEDYRIYGVRLL